MAIYFKAKVSHQVMDEDSGVSKKQHINMVIDAVNYNDAEITVVSFCEYFHYDTYTYDINKMQISDLIIDYNSSQATKEMSELNKLVLISEFDSDPKPVSDGFGLYKASFSVDDEGKVKKFNTHILAKNLDSASDICKKFIQKYYDNTGTVSKLSKEPESCLLLSNEKFKYAKEVFSNSTGNKEPERTNQYNSKI